MSRFDWTPGHRLEAGWAMNLQSSSGRRFWFWRTNRTRSAGPWRAGGSQRRRRLDPVEATRTCQTCKTLPRDPVELRFWPCMSHIAWWAVRAAAESAAGRLQRFSNRAQAKSSRAGIQPIRFESKLCRASTSTPHGSWLPSRVRPAAWLSAP